MLLFADYVLTLIHVLVVLCVVFGWVPKRTRRGHRWLVACTFMSWVALGPFYGFGYCVLTGWHWDIKGARGLKPETSSFIKWAIDSSTGWDAPAAWVNNATIGVFVVICLITPVLWWRERG